MVRTNADRSTYPSLFVFTLDIRAELIMAVSLLALFVALICTAQAGVVTLTEENFEHLTQASTGATTGDWFIKVRFAWLFQ